MASRLGLVCSLGSSRHNGLMDVRGLDQSHSWASLLGSASSFKGELIYYPLQF